MVFRYNLAGTGAPAAKEMTQAVFEYLQANWAALQPSISPALAEITFANSFEGISGECAVIVKNLTANIEPGQVGDSRKSHEHFMQIYVLAYGQDARTKTFTMAENIFDLIDSDSGAMSGSGIEEAHIGQFKETNVFQTDDDIMRGKLQAEGSSMKVVTLTAYYDKVA